MMSRARPGTGDTSDIPTEVGLLGTLLAVSVLVVHVPAAVWAGNTTEFTLGYTSFLGLGLAVTAAAVLVTWLVLRILPQPRRLAVAALISGVGVIWWGYGMLFVGRMRVLNGVDEPLNFETALGRWELALVAGVCLLLAWVIHRKPAPARQLLLVFNIGLAVVTATTLVGAWGTSRHSRVADAAAVFRFSPKQNVLIILLDGLQSDVADRVLRADRRLAAEFAGFRLFPDTLGVAPTTFLSLPAIHSGEVYDGGPGLSSYLTDSIEQRSFVNLFARAGYHTTLVNPVLDICPAQTATCVSATRLLRSPLARAKSEAVRLLDLALFRVAPVRLKRRIYREGNWLISGRVDQPDGIAQVLEGNRLLEEVARRLTVDAGTPTLKFLHSKSTHTPYVLDRGCGVVDTALEHLGSQSRCALRAVATLLRRLRQTGIYDSTVILVVADHGINPGVFGLDAPGSHEQWVHRAGAANPLFLLKPLHAHGRLQRESEPVYLPDVGATLCDRSGACAVTNGIPAGSALPGRVRRFTLHPWQHRFWTLQELPDITPYDVLGPVNDKASWRPGATNDRDERSSGH
jgi:hypothetical protein